LSLEELRLELFTPPSPAPLQEGSRVTLARTSNQRRSRVFATIAALVAISGVIGTPAMAGEAPRLYLHYQTESQRAGVIAFQKAFSGQTLSGMPIQVVLNPGEPRSKYQRTSVVCERSVDCRFAGKLAETIGGVLGQSVAVRDLSARYEATTRARALHFELWFDASPISIRARAVPPVATPVPQPDQLDAQSNNADPMQAPEPTSEDVPITAAVLVPAVVSEGDTVRVVFSRPPNSKGGFYTVTVDGVAAAVKQSGNTLEFVVPPLPRNRFTTRTVNFTIRTDNGLPITGRSLTLAPSFGSYSFLGGLLAAFTLIIAASFLAWRSIHGRYLSLTRAEGVGTKVVTRLTAPPVTPIDGPDDDLLPPGEMEAPPASPLAGIEPWQLGLPPALVKAVRARHAALVVGAALSERAGLPSQIELTLTLLRGLGSELPQSLRSIVGDKVSEAGIRSVTQRMGGAAKLFEAIIHAVPRERVTEIICEVLPTEPSPLHRLLAALPFSTLVDLNLDDLLARALDEQAGSAASQIVQATVNDSNELLTNLRSSSRVLFKPSGTRDQPSTIALTAEEMRRAVGLAPDYQRALSALLQSETFLFVGLTPEAVEQFLYAVAPDYAQSAARHYALVPHDPVNDLRESALGRFGVSLLSYDPRPGGYGPEDFVSRLLEQTEQGERADDPALPSFILSPDRVDRIYLENIGPFEKIEFFLSQREKGPKANRPVRHADASEAHQPQESEQSPWWVLFGGNGVGKSTVLRALAVALAGNTPAAAAAGRRLLRSGAPHGLIEIQVGRQTLRTRVVSERANVIVSPSQKTPVELGRTLALGFPALRGARTPDPTGANSQAEVREPDPADLQALIAGDVDGRLGDFKQWLVNTLSKPKSDLRAQEMRKLLDQLIREIIPGRIDALADLRPGEWIVRVETPDGEVPFDELSQGMASIFNWVGLLAQRMYTICENSPRPQDEPAIVIIDEVDAHLHPEWQRRLVPLTRKFFPNVQVIATSHSPLLAGSLRMHEIGVLVRDHEGKNITIARHGDTYGLMSQDIMTSGVFDMLTDRNVEVERLIQRYCSLYESRERSLDDDVELEELRRKLSRFGFGALGAPDRPSDTEEDLERLRKRFGSSEGAPA
jgi:energy-coupling factor transporter ATP-binding protein EcfA2